MSQVKAPESNKLIDQRHKPTLIKRVLWLGTFTAAMVVLVVLLIYFDTRTLRPREKVGQSVFIENVDSRQLVAYSFDASAGRLLPYPDLLEADTSSQDVAGNRWTFSLIGVYIAMDRLEDHRVDVNYRDDSSLDMILKLEGTTRYVAWDPDHRRWELAETVNVCAVSRQETLQVDDSNYVITSLRGTGGTGGTGGGRHASDCSGTFVLNSVCNRRGIFQVLPLFGSPSRFYLYSRDLEMFLWFNPTTRLYEMHPSRKTKLALEENVNGTS